MDAQPVRRAPGSGGADDIGFESTLSRMARVLTGQHGLAVVFSADGPRLEPGRIVIPRYEVHDEHDRDALTGYLDLLVARATYSSNEELAALGSGTAQRIAQVIEDRRVCERFLARYAGAKRYLGRLRAHAAQDAAQRWKKLAWRDKLVWLIERTLWNETPAAGELSQPLAAALRAVDVQIAQARASRSTGDSIHSARALIAVVRALSASDFNTMSFTAGAADGYDVQTVRDTFDAFDSPGESNGYGARDEAPPAGAQGGASKDSADSVGMGHSPLAAPSASADGANKASGVAPERPLFSVPLTTAFDVVTDLTGRGDVREWHALRALARADTAPLKAKLERALKVDELTHWKREQERGEIDRTALARLALSPGYRTPFRVKRRNQGRDTAVSLLIDRSGSMAGRKIELARLCAAALCDALTQLQFEAEVLGYSSVESAEMKALYEQQRALGVDMRTCNRLTERLDLHVYKRFGSSDLSGLQRIDCGHENPDGEALAWAASRLADYPAARRILMVLSDGYPSTGDGDPAVLASDLRLRVEALQRKGIEIIGVGILDDAVQAFYPKSVVVRKLHELPGVALSVLGAMLLNR